jgi:hypothetical protein
MAFRYYLQQVRMILWLSRIDLSALFIICLSHFDVGDILLLGAPGDFDSADSFKSDLSSGLEVVFSFSVLFVLSCSGDASDLKVSNILLMSPATFS